MLNFIKAIWLVWVKKTHGVYPNSLLKDAATLSVVQPHTASFKDAKARINQICSDAST